MHTKATQIKSSVREMAESVYSSGNLSSIQFGSISGVDGIRLHQKVYSKLETEHPNHNVQPEMLLTGSYHHDNILLEINGRADCVVLPGKKSFKKTLPIIYEIKSHNKQSIDYDTLFRQCHLTQLKLYGHMFLCEHSQYKNVLLCMRYVSIHTIEYTDKTYSFSKEELRVFFNQSCQKYINHAKIRMNYISMRDQSIEHISFPYNELRDGQKAFMQRVLSTVKNKQILFAQAPTGIGKTISVLYPAVKALKHRWNNKVFYLTAKKSTREVAQKCLEDMRINGLYLKSILLSPKEQMCPVPEIYCEPLECPYAIGYYDRRNFALEELEENMNITPTIIIEIAQKHRLCPHELALDISILCDVIIGDYNHAFHPRIRLERFFSNDDQTHLLLIDEAHNLVERARDMFSAEMSQADWSELNTNVHGLDQRIDGHLSDILSYYNCVGHYLQKQKNAFIHVEPGCDNTPTYITSNYQAMTAPPKTLYASVWRLCFHLAKHLDNLPSNYNRKKILDAYLTARFFLHILEHYFDQTYIFSCRYNTSNDIILKLHNLDAANKINSLLSDHHSAVFFSATLSPSNYYQCMLLGKNSDIVDHIVLESPFPKENFKPVIYTEISTAYQNRHATKQNISDLLIRLLKNIKGNYICFFPSFTYMHLIFDHIHEYLEKNIDIDTLVQKPEMNEKEKIDFLNRFNNYGEKTLIAFAVLGGHFAEGIDLVGDKLNGVIIIGSGLPLVSPEREIIMQYYQDKFNDGFAYAYRFPGWEKVLQASGRVIRDENDTGFALLIDHRYASPPYRQLFPQHWDTYFAQNTEDIISYLSELNE